MDRYIRELELFKQRHENFKLTARRAFQDQSQRLLDYPVQAALNALNVIEFVAMHELADNVLYQFSLYELESGERHIGTRPKQKWDSFWEYCNRELLHRTDTPPEIAPAHRLYYDAQRSRYAKEVIYLRDRRAILESKTK